MSTAEELTKMLEVAVSVVDNENVTLGTANSADDCVQSLLKSMAKLGYDKVKENK